MRPYATNVSMLLDGSRQTKRLGSQRMLTYADTAYVAKLVRHSDIDSIRHSIRQHTSAYVDIRQHTSANVSIREHTSAHVSDIGLGASRHARSTCGRMLTYADVC